MIKWNKVGIWAVALITHFFFGSGWRPSWAGENGILMADRFTGGQSSEGIPVGWKPEEMPGNQSKISLEKGKDGFYLRILSVREAFGVRKEIELDIREYPYLSRYWRALRLPKGGDVRRRDTDDQAGRIYVIFPKVPTMVNSRSMGYLWDTKAPVGLMVTSTAYSKMKYVVLQSGTAKLGQWVFETRNVYEDYKKAFEEDPSLVGSIFLYINSQHTRSSAECHYVDIFFPAVPRHDEAEEMSPMALWFLES